MLIRRLLAAAAAVGMLSACGSTTSGMSAGTSDVRGAAEAVAAVLTDVATGGTPSSLRDALIGVAADYPGVAVMQIVPGTVDVATRDVAYCVTPGTDRFEIRDQACDAMLQELREDTEGSTAIQLAAQLDRILRSAAQVEEVEPVALDTSIVADLLGSLDGAGATLAIAGTWADTPRIDVTAEDGSQACLVVGTRDTAGTIDEGACP